MYYSIFILYNRIIEIINSYKEQLQIYICFYNHIIIMSIIVFSYGSVILFNIPEQVNELIY